MTLFLHEMKRARISLLVWTAAISAMMVVTVFIYPQMSSQMNEVSKAFQDMGSFSRAFGMDKLNFGELTDYFLVECGNVLGLGGAIFAAIAGANALAKEERDNTAEFLCTHPVSRMSIALSKLLSVYLQIAVLTAVVAGLSLLSILLIGESVSGVLALSLVAYFLLELEIASVAFAVSAFAVRGGTGIGIGIAFGFYFLNILSNLTEDAEFLRYLTPFAMTEGTELKENGLRGSYLAIIAAVSLVSVLVAFLRYRKKDL